MYKSFFKRILDIIIALLFLILLLPVFMLASVLIKLSSKGPVFFMQERVGLNGTPFTAFKFRTMYDRPREVEKVLKDDPDVTVVGYYLRRFKIDELPQLLNVLFGEMSIVGPRPSVSSLIETFNEDGKFRIRVKPGLTGLAQVNGNIHLSWPERWKHDRYYVENLSFVLDLKIILKTIAIVFHGEDKFINKIQ